MNKILMAIAGSTLLLSAVAEAVPWCHRGTIVQIANVSWSEAQILANYTGSIPGGVSDPQYYITAMATNNYANTFAGGGGGFGGYSVPGSGQVSVHPYAPYTYTNMVGPGYYFTSQGIKFKLNKCYTIPPMTHHKELQRFEPDVGGIIFEPYSEIKNIEYFWLPNENDKRK
ncbi:hypothetical protein CJF42_00260 [Pseudoalteromonas sp. NBT06-2]|uniref:hypothetical protein n=1 Tax=Pseudoalteromonas sp. NBT06-2 TaxID=2025950 RepID=UPI000BA5384A|nr:hypothetical protein [Pseudoalteromonas sp. NBT06-2]PAJ76370.1 hypothetical protein CJF42_00260 [Pseudoalteromonas sp. NBT06-2]